MEDGSNFGVPARLEGIVVQSVSPACQRTASWMPVTSAKVLPGGSGGITAKRLEARWVLGSKLSPERNLAACGGRSISLSSATG